MLYLLFVVAMLAAASVGLLVGALGAAAGRPTPAPAGPDTLQELEAEVTRASAGRVLIAVASGVEPDRASLVNLAGGVLGIWDDPDTDPDSGSPWAWDDDPQPVAPSHRAGEHSHGVRASRLVGFEAGQTMAEYAVVLGVITVAVVATLGLLTGAITAELHSIITTLTPTP